MEYLNEILWVVYGMSSIPAAMLVIKLITKTLPDIAMLIIRDVIDVAKAYWAGVAGMLFKPSKLVA